jgi:DNA-binding response OmpR family regulator
MSVSDTMAGTPPVTLSPPCRSPCAVCIDDDEDFLSLLVRHLDDLGVAAIPASNAILGVRTIQRECPDLVILDYQMPNAHGSYVLRCMQQDQDLSAMPVIVVTGRDVARRVGSSHTLEQQLRHLGAQSVLRKPLNVHSLNAAIQLCLGQSGSRECTCRRALKTRNDV